MYNIVALAVPKNENSFQLDTLCTYDLLDKMENCIKIYETWIQDYQILYFEISDFNNSKIIYQESFINIGHRDLKNCKHRLVIEKLNKHYLEKLKEDITNNG